MAEGNLMVADETTDGNDR